MRTRAPGGAADQRDASREREKVANCAAMWVRQEDRDHPGRIHRTMGDLVFLHFGLDVTDMTISRWRREVHR